jgi:hypothetical protein
MPSSKAISVWITVAAVAALAADAWLLIGPDEWAELSWILILACGFAAMPACLKAPAVGGVAFLFSAVHASGLFLFVSLNSVTFFGGDVIYVIAAYAWVLVSILLGGASLAVLIFRERPPKILPDYECRRCGYNLTGNASGICSECGTPIPEEQRTQLAARGTRGEE